MEKNNLKLLKFLNPVEHQQEPESIEGIFPKDLECSKMKNEIIKSKNWKSKLTERI